MQADDLVPCDWSVIMTGGTFHIGEDSVLWDWLTWRCRMPTRSGEAPHPVATGYGWWRKTPPFSGLIVESRIRLRVMGAMDGIDNIEGYSNEVLHPGRRIACEALCRQNFDGQFPGSAAGIESGLRLAMNRRKGIDEEQEGCREIIRHMTIQRA